MADADVVRLDPKSLQAMLDKAAEDGARRALGMLGLHDEDAANDLRELRGLLDTWRDVRRSVVKTVATAITSAVLALLAAGTAWQFWTKGS